MGVNGISEAFLYGCIKKEHLKYFRYVIFVSTGFYLLFCILLIKYGSIGLIIANSLSMLIRISICFYFMKFTFSS